MALVDLDHQRIRLSVRELSQGPAPGPRVAGLSAAARAQLGQRVHREYQAQRSRHDRSFRAEVPVTVRRQVDGFVAEIHGRIDGLSESAQGALVVEEAKSVTMNADELGALDEEQLAAFGLQLRLYALGMAQRQPRRPIMALLVLESLLDGRRRTLALPFDAQETGLELDEMLRDLIRHAQQRRLYAEHLAQLAARLRFPYRHARPNQLELIESISAALERGRPVVAMAPTGLGKTVSALLPALRHALPRAGSVWFLTAKNTQQQLVASAFEELCAAAKLPTASVTAITLRAKARMCPPGHLQCHPELCPLLLDFDERLGAAGRIDELRDRAVHVTPDQVLELGAATGLCPFEISLALARKAELIIGDYNYVYDDWPSFGGPMGHGRPRVVVVDEAHNLFDRARQACSSFVPLRAVRQAQHGMLAGKLPRSAAPAPWPCPGAELTEELVALCRDIGDAIEQALGEAEQAECCFIDGCCTIEPDVDAWTRRSERATRWLLRYAARERPQPVVLRRNPTVDLLREVGRLSAALRESQRELVPYAAHATAARGCGIGVACVNPARHLAAHHRSALGTVAMSATLSPLPYYAEVLGLSALDPVLTSVPCPFPPEHRQVLIVPSVATTYRERGQHARRIAELIDQVVRARPGRYIAFFPSFAFLSEVRAHVALPAEQLMVQLPQMPAASRSSVLCRLRSESGPKLLLAVMGGVFAEGIDLPGDGLIGVIIVGPGLPAVDFERTLMRWYFDEQDDCGNAYALLYPGMQRVIQAAGRVIRTMEDRGVIVLLGRRFGEPAFADCLPADWYHHHPRELCADEPGPALERFWSAVEPPGTAEATEAICPQGRPRTRRLTAP